MTEQRWSQVFDLQSQVKSQISYGGNERSSATVGLLRTQHRYILMEFKACTALQIVEAHG